MDEKKEQSKEKPLENMTVKELREIAKEMPGNYRSSRAEQSGVVQRRKKSKENYR